MSLLPNTNLPEKEEKYLTEAEVRSVIDSEFVNFSSNVRMKSGSIILDEAGNIRSVQTGYDTGVGWWLGNDSGTPKFSIGNSAGNKLTWNGSSLNIIGNIQTNSSGKRIVLSSSDNSLSFYDASNNLILGLGTEVDRNFIIESATNIISFRVYNNSSLALTVANLASFDVQNNLSTADSLQLTNTGSGLCLHALNTGTGGGAYISTSSSTVEALRVNQDDLSKSGILVVSVSALDSIKEMLEIYRMSGGAGVSSQGAAIGFYGRDSVANKEQIGSLGFGFTNQTNGSEASKALITLRGTDILELRSTGTVVIGNQAALATNATDGFLYIPTSAGVPTGTPTSFTGKVAMEYDTNNNKLYIYNGGWKSVALF